MNVLDYSKTLFVKSYAKSNDIKITKSIEIVFSGYSNSGKSSAINALTNQKKLARCSKTPGRTQLINFFEVVTGFSIVDLPGYGYTKAPLFIRKEWEEKIYNYLKTRIQIKGLVLLMDIRHPLKVLDLKIIDIALNKNFSILVLLTKCDKIKKSKRTIVLNMVFNKLNTLSSSFEIELFSSFEKIGIEKLKLNLNNWYNKYINFKD